MLTEGLMTNTETVSNSVTTISTTSTSSKDRTLSTRTNQESSPVSGIQTTGLHSTADTLTNKAQFTVKMVSPNPIGREPHKLVVLSPRTTLVLVWAANPHQYTYLVRL